MIVKDDIVSPRKALTDAQRAQLEGRLRRAQQAVGTNGEGRPSIPRRPRDAQIPLSFAQERLWFLDQLDPGSPVYNLCQAVRLRGELKVAALEQSLNEIIRRHEILRTNFMTAEGAGIQVVAPSRTLQLPVIESGNDQDENRRLRDEACKPFDLTRDLLVRALLVRRNPTEHILVLTMHHIISDGWSIGILFRELAAAYAAHGASQPFTPPALPIQFADFVLWERENFRGAGIERQIGYWKQQLGGTLPVLDLPTDHPRTAEATARGGVHSLRIAPATAQALKALSQREGGTLFMTLLAAFQVLLCRWTGQEDILVGSVVAGRRKVELEKLIGFFVNTVVLRGNLAGAPSFRELLGRVRETVLGAFANQDVPFEELVKVLRPDRAVSRNPLFQVMFILQNIPGALAELPGLGVESIDLDTGTAKFDLTLAMMEGPAGLVAAFEYNADLFEPATVARLAGGFQTLLDGIAAGADQPITTLPLLSPADRQRMLEDWNGRRLDYPERCIHELFAEQVQRTPHAIAVIGGHERLTYRELDARAESLAAELRAAGVGPESLVGVFLTRQAHLAVALLGVLKAGGAYVPLDPAYPAERISYIVGQANMEVLITERALAERAPQNGARVMLVDAPTTNASGAVTLPSAAAITARNLAYVIYTSGSTGRPKGVAVEHRSVAALIAASRELFQPEELAGVVAASSVCFDVSVFEFFVPLCTGGKTILAENILQLPALPAANEVAMIIGVPSAVNELVRAGTMPKSVRVLGLGGEPCSQIFVETLYGLGHVKRVFDLYGPTESTVFSTQSLRTPGGQATIGHPLPNEQAYVLDRAMAPVPVGVSGELYLGGDKLARGYLHQPELTAERFVADPFHPGGRLYRTGDRARYRADGQIEFLGRLDHQVKLRGFRIELGEIESVLRQFPGVADCVTIVHAGAGDPRLVAYFVPQTPRSVDSRDLRGHLEQRVPLYMIPSAFVELERLPVTPNGKVDLKALPAVDGANADRAEQYLAPRDDVEQRLALIWEEILGVKPVGIRDPFFELGGHSLLAVRMIAQMEKIFARKLPVAVIFQHGTVEQLARLLRSDGAVMAPANSIVEIQGKGSSNPVYFVHGIGGGMFWGYSNLARYIGPDRPMYAFKSRGLDGHPEWSSIEEMAQHYIADLRARQPHGPYLLGGYCFGGVVAYEMARQLEAADEKVGLLALINSTPPHSSYGQTGSRWSPVWQFKFWRNIAYWAGAFLFRWSLRERAEFITWKFSALRRKLTGRFFGRPVEAAPSDLSDLPVAGIYSDERRELWETHFRQLVAYRPQPYGGRVTLFRTRGHSLVSSFDDEFGWGEFAGGGVEVKILPGGHGNILAEPHVRLVAGAMATELRAAGSAVTPAASVQPSGRECAHPANESLA